MTGSKKFQVDVKVVLTYRVIVESDSVRNVKDWVFDMGTDRIMEEGLLIDEYLDINEDTVKELLPKRVVKR